MQFSELDFVCLQKSSADYWDFKNLDYIYRPLLSSELSTSTQIGRPIFHFFTFSSFISFFKSLTQGRPGILYFNMVILYSDITILNKVDFYCAFLLFLADSFFLKFGLSTGLYFFNRSQGPIKIRREMIRLLQRHFYIKIIIHLSHLKVPQLLTVNISNNSNSLIRNIWSTGQKWPLKVTWG